MRDRRTYLGGPDLAAVLGLHPYQSPYAVWLEKTAPRDEPEPVDWWQDSPSEAAWWGTQAEATILRAYELRTGRKLEPGRFVESDRPHIAGTPDGFSEPAVVEAKNVGYQAWQANGEDVPDHHRVQGLYYAGLTRADYVDFAVCVGGNHLELRRLVVDDHQADIDAIVEFADRWWQHHVVRGHAPEVDGNQATRDALLRRWGRTATVERVDLSEEYREVLAERHRTRALLRDLQAEVDRLDNELIAALGGATDAYLPGDERPAWTWRSVTSHRDQPKAIRQAHEAALPLPDGVTPEDVATAVMVMDRFETRNETRRFDARAPRRKKET